MTHFLRLISTFIVLFILISAGNIFAQINITQQDLQSLIGKKFNTEVDTGVVVNVGSPGENQIWDFTGLSLNGTVMVTEYMSPQNTPFPNDFPSANWVEKSMVDFDGLSGTMYHFRRIEASSFSSLGDGMIFGEFQQVNVDESEVIPLPLTYGAQWVSEFIDTVAAVEGAISLYRDKIETRVDGWGKVKLPSGEFDALRVRDDYLYINETWFGDLLIFSDTSSSIGYTWISKAPMILVSIGSPDGINDPNFDYAAEVFMKTDDPGTGLAGVAAGSPSDFQLYQNYPNPFNPQTTIDFSLPVSSNVEIVVFDTQGKKVTTLVSGTKSAGNHSVSWNAANYTSGIYYYAIRAGEFSQTRKMILVK